MVFFGASAVIWGWGRGVLLLPNRNTTNDLRPSEIPIIFLPDRSVSHAVSKSLSHAEFQFYSCSAVTHNSYIRFRQSDVCLQVLVLPRLLIWLHFVFNWNL